MSFMIEKSWQRWQPQGGASNSSDEWLGPESHVPNLRQELRRRNKSAGAMRGWWAAGIVFVTGVAVGGLATYLVSHSKRNR